MQPIFASNLLVVWGRHVDRLCVACVVCLLSLDLSTFVHWLCHCGASCMSRLHECVGCWWWAWVASKATGSCQLWQSVQLHGCRLCDGNVHVASECHWNFGSQTAEPRLLLPRLLPTGQPGDKFHRQPGLFTSGLSGLVL